MAILGAQSPFPVHKISEHVHCLQLYPTGAPLSSPFIPLEQGQLTLEFDDLSGTSPMYYLRFKHCTFDWYASPNAMVGDFLEGFQEPAVEEVEASFGTKINYTHYRTTFPNDLTRFTRSGNYIVEIIDPREPKSPVAQARFVIYEDLVSLSGGVVDSPQLDEVRSHQALEFTLNTQGYPVQDPYEALQVAVLQNGFWSLQLRSLPPRFVRGQEVDYRTADLANFPGANSWRFADLKSLRFVSQGVQSIEEGDRFWHIGLEPDERRAYKVFDAVTDINGAFMIHNDRFDAATQSDYVMASFVHPTREPYPGPVYLFGAFSGGMLNERFRMQWNSGRSRYEAEILLKQGYYNYLLACPAPFKDQAPEPPTLLPEDLFSVIEGGHRLTGNRYDVFAYYWDIAGYDRVIGYAGME